MPESKPASTWGGFCNTAMTTMKTSIPLLLDSITVICIPALWMGDGITISEPEDQSHLTSQY